VAVVVERLAQVLKLVQMEVLVVQVLLLFLTHHHF
jgi:hypothetical protein